MGTLDECQNFFTVLEKDMLEYKGSTFFPFDFLILKIWNFSYCLSRIV